MRAITQTSLVIVVVAMTLPTAAIAQSSFKPTAQNSIVPADAKLELVYNDAEFTESPVLAADGAILFSDIGTRILRYDPRNGKTTVFREPSGRANGLMFDSQGRLVACEGANTGGNRRISITDSDGKVRTLADRFEGKRFNSPNDLAIDAQGRVYFTDPRYRGEEPRELDFEGVFVVHPDGKVAVATRDVTKPNGILVSPDGKTVYVADHDSREQGPHQLLAFDVGIEGVLSRKRVLHDFGPNRRGIDGMTLDRQGNIYATAGRDEEAGIYVFDPEGRHLAFIAMPGDPTNCDFGGGEESKTLYITAAGPKLEKPDMPRKYGLYRIRLANDGYRLFPK
jgi:gluconolactonase